MKKGILVISLDFELFWGIGDHINYKEYQNYFDNTLKAIPEILELFSKYQIHCTWATVGMLWNENWEEWKKNIPNKAPDYLNPLLSNYLLDEKISFENVDSSHFFALDLIKKISNTRGQEIGTHTYSHYYCNEKNRNIEAWNEDLINAIKIASKTQSELKSLVLPRNQFLEEVVEGINTNGIETVRTNPDVWYWHLKNQNNKSSRIARLIDSYTTVFEGKGYAWSNLKINNGVLLQPASRFLRPISQKFPFLNRLRINRIKKEMTFAAKNNEIYHLWWHPHNFAIDRKKALAELKEVILHFQKLNDEFNFSSYNMLDVLNSYKNDLKGE